jgi:hypothetical protein
MGRVAHGDRANTSPFADGSIGDSVPPAHPSGLLPDRIDNTRQGAML